MILVLIISILGALLTFELAKHSRFGPVRASAILSIMFALISPYLFVESDAKILAAVFFGGSFVGMTSTERLNRFGIIWSGLLFGITYWLLVGHITGMGGALGLSAFISVSITILKLQTLSLLAQRNRAR